MVVKTASRMKGFMLCEKCNSMMFTRRIAANSSDPTKFIDVNQCDVCRFWIPLD